MRRRASKLLTSWMPRHVEDISRRSKGEVEGIVPETGVPTLVKKTSGRRRRRGSALRMSLSCFDPEDVQIGFTKPTARPPVKKGTLETCPATLPKIVNGGGSMACRPGTGWASSMTGGGRHPHGGSRPTLAVAPPPGWQRSVVECQDSRRAPHVGTYASSSRVGGTRVLLRAGFKTSDMVQSTGVPSCWRRW